MFNYLLAIAVDEVKDHSYTWLLTAAAAVVPLLALITKKRKHRWLPRLLFKKANSKKAGFLKRLLLKGVVRSGDKKMSDGLAVFLFILGIIGLGALMVWLLGWAWTIILILLGLLILGRKRTERDYE
jgi:hypothetical protein